MKQLVAAVSKFGPIHEYFTSIIKPLAEMLQSPLSSEELKIGILDVLIERIAVDAMPDHFMALSESILEMLNRTNDHYTKEKALDVLDLIKWAMIRSDQWSSEYDEAMEARLATVPGVRKKLHKWGMSGDSRALGNIIPRPEPRNCSIISKNRSSKIP